MNKPTSKGTINITKLGFDKKSYICLNLIKSMRNNGFDRYIIPFESYSEDFRDYIKSKLVNFKKRLKPAYANDEIGCWILEEERIQ